MTAGRGPVRFGYIALLTITTARGLNAQARYAW